MREHLTMELGSIAGVIALLVTLATVVFIYYGISMPDWWGAVVVSTIMAKLFGGKNGNGGGP